MHHNNNSEGTDSRMIRTRRKQSIVRSLPSSSIGGISSKVDRGVTVSRA